MYCMLLFGSILSSVAWIARTEGEPSDSFDIVSSPAPGGSFQCQRPGRFVNPDDPSCRTYLTCVPDTDPDRGPFALRQDECGANALFSGRYQRCITGSDCATLEDFYAIEYECYECGKFVLPGSTDCRQFVNCLKTKDPGVFVPIRQSCPVGKLFSGDAHACVLEEEFECGAEKPSTTPRMLSNVSPLPAAQVADAAFSGGHLSDFVCLSPGRFPDESVPHCRGYRWCTSEHTADQPPSGRLVSRNFLCASGQVFSEIEKRCVPTGSYQCPDDDVSADRFRCVAVGRFPDRSASGCERYFHCQRTATGTLKATLAQCPTGTVFSWLTTRCVPSAEYVCPVAAIGADLAIPGETVAVVLPALKQPDPKGDAESNNRTRSSHRNRCSSSGRFANDADAHCRTYFICTRDARGAWARVLVRCPAGTLFSRTASRCVGSETVPQPFCAVSVPTTVLPILLNLDEDSPEHPGADSDEELHCSEPDRLLPNPTDRTCRTYFGCQWDDATEQNTRRLRLHLLQCPQGMVFSSGAARCVIARTRPELEHSVNDDIFDDGASGAYSTVCAEPGDDGSGQSFDHSEQTWPSTSTVPAVTRPEYSTTEQSTASVSASTGKLTSSNAADITERIVTQDGAGDGGGGSFSYSGPAPEYPCTATGRFADINSVDCRSYFLCKLQQPSGSFVSVHLTCPDGMVFSRNVNKCIVSNRHVC